tara:strand:+ start:1001 stop:1918 length:918 start_codon:yes stop_codon:yes gene_type:complete
MKFIYSIILFFPFLVQSQAFKPTGMVIPADIYMQNYDGYADAFLKDRDLRNVIAQINDYFAAQNYQLESLEQSLKSIENDDLRNQARNMSNRSGSEVQESAMSKIMRLVAPDIRFELDYEIGQDGFSNYVVLNLSALDPYTNKQIASVSNTGAPAATNNISLLLQSALKDNMSNFESKLNDHFANLFENGREISLEVLINDGSPVYLDDMFNYSPYNMDDELSYIIEEWVNQNTLNSSYGSPRISYDQMVVTQVKIPMTNDRGRALNARSWLNGLSRILRGEPFNLPCYVEDGGLGKAFLIIGDR